MDRPGAYRTEGPREAAPPRPREQPISGPELAESIIYGAVVVGGAGDTGESGDVDMIVGEWTDQGSWADDYRT